MIDGVVPPYLAYNGKYLLQVLSDGLCGFKHYWFDSKEEARKRFEEIVLENKFYSVTYGIYHNKRDITIKPEPLAHLHTNIQGGIMPTAEERDSFAMQAPNSPSTDPRYPVQTHGFKDENKEIHYLGLMLTATRIEDKQRLESIAERLFVLSGASQGALGTIVPHFLTHVDGTESADTIRAAYVRGLVNKYKDVDLSANPVIAYLRELVCDPWENYFDPQTPNKIKTEKGRVV